ncbi:Prolyl-tRNA synthetase, bacterial type [hydrothermal vent metagenome]|uniref:Proline--tRNA ligase n=1 Tax=hydrothermal vent metagenome TaxID=652676 RepID=A0A3B1BRV3_9ZZZZ
MRFSKFYLPTLKEVPAEAEIASHRLMLRAGVIRKLSAGVYTLLPLGVKVIRKIETIVRDEMDKAGALEVSMPSIQPAQLWRESGRWEMYGKELLRINDRNGREFCYGPTHEEVVTDLVRGEIRSYKNLPLNLYQIQTKFRDEIRPRFGVMRAREFSMKDAYSFDADDAGVEKSYSLMKKAYNAIFTRLNLKFRAVEADTGQIGGAFSHEFMALAESGEDMIAYCDKCEYAANVDKVETKEPEAPGGEMGRLEDVATPGMGSIEEVSEFLKMPSSSFIKTLVYKTDLKEKEFVAVLCRGDHEINETKLARALDCNEVELADAENVERITGAPVGFAGPMGLEITLIADHGVKSISNGVTGANKADTHIKNMNPSRDFPEATEYADIREAVVDDPCPRCETGRMKMARGIEVGHIFKLGVKYSEAMGATFLDKDGKEKPMIMGCYGMGIARTAAAAIEQNHDENGIIWPVAIAPFKVAVLPLNIKDDEINQAAEKIYKGLGDAGHEPIYDDRNMRPGVKFNDADLAGFPVQVIVGKKGLKDGVAEIKVRLTGARDTAPLDEVVSKVGQLLDDLATKA